MSKSTSTESKGWMWLSGRWTFALALSAAVLMFGIAGARADGKASFGSLAPETRLAALEPQHRLVDTVDLADERARGVTPGLASAPEDGGKVAVILWDDAWSELQRRGRSAGAAATAGSNAGSTLAGSSGTQAN